jgi:hypothetical protein
MQSVGQIMGMMAQAAAQHGLPVTVSPGVDARGAVGTSSRPAGGAGGASDGSGPSGKLPAPARWSESSAKGRKPSTFLADAKEWLVRSRYEPAASFHLLLEGYDDSSNTWEPRTNLLTCECLIREYHRFAGIAPPPDKWFK